MPELIPLLNTALNPHVGVLQYIKERKISQKRRLYNSPRLFCQAFFPVCAGTVIIFFYFCLFLFAVY